MEYLGGLNEITGSLTMEERGRGQGYMTWEGLDQLLALKIERGMNQRVKTASRSWKSQGNGFSPNAPGKEQSADDTLILACAGLLTYRNVR